MPQTCNVTGMGEQHLISRPGHHGHAHREHVTKGDPGSVDVTRHRVIETTALVVVS